MSAIKEHNQICLINSRNNQLLSLMFFEIYFMTGFMINMLLLQAFYINNILLFKIFFAMIGFYIIFGTSIVSYFANSLSHAAYSSYARLNSIVARGQYGKKEGRWFHGISFTFKSQFKLVNLIERLSGSENGYDQIAVYCLNLFAIDTWQYILLMSNIIANYMMMMELID